MLALGSYAIASGGEELDSGSGLPPAFVGGLLLPILGAVPDAMVIIFSVVSATDETANSMLAVGMGTLAGSSAILLTLPWVIGVVLGRMQFTVTAVKSALSSGSSGAAANEGATAAEHAAHEPSAALRTRRVSADENPESDSTESSESTTDATEVDEDLPYDSESAADEEDELDDEGAARTAPQPLALAPMPRPRRRSSRSSSAALVLLPAVKVPCCCPWRTLNIRAKRVHSGKEMPPPLRCCPHEPFIKPMRWLWCACPSRRPAMPAAATSAAVSGALAFVARKEGWWTSDFWTLQGVTVYGEVRGVSLLMTSTTLCYLVVQLPVWLFSIPALIEWRQLATRIACFVGMLVCIAQFVVYVVVQCASPKIAAKQMRTHQSNARKRRWLKFQDSNEFRAWRSANLTRKEARANHRAALVKEFKLLEERQQRTAIHTSSKKRRGSTSKTVPAAKLASKDAHAAADAGISMIAVTRPSQLADITEEELERTEDRAVKKQCSRTFDLVAAHLASPERRKSSVDTSVDTSVDLASVILLQKNVDRALGLLSTKLGVAREELEREEIDKVVRRQASRTMKLTLALLCADVTEEPQVAAMLNEQSLHTSFSRWKKLHCAHELHMGIGEWKISHDLPLEEGDMEDASDEPSNQLAGHDGNGNNPFSLEALVGQKIYSIGKAVVMIGVGLALVTLFADAFVAANTSFAEILGISPFFVAVIVVPTVSNAAEIFVSIGSAAKKRRRGLSLLYNTLYVSLSRVETPRGRHYY